jgi:HAD superfamily hydrolase (TIGR01509 family)
MKQIDTVLLDWDGTLINSSQLSFAAFQKAFRDLGIFLGSDQYQRVYSPDWRNIYRALELPPQKWEEADKLWIQYYGQEIPPMVEGGRRALEDLAEKCCLGVVTSGSRARVWREIDALGLAKYFQTVISGDDVRYKKPHPEGLQTAMKQICREPHTCCYVGDSPEDVEMGKRAGVLTIGIQSRYPGSDRLLNAKPNFCIKSMSQLSDALRFWSSFCRKTRFEARRAARE